MLLKPYNTTSVRTCYSSPKMEVREIHELGFSGVFASAEIKKDELLTIALGELIHKEDLQNRIDGSQVHAYQIEESFYIAPSDPLNLDVPYYVNHCCDPTAWLSGAVSLIARRDIAVGEQITFDYATCDGSPYDEFICACGAANCRHRITGNDWKLPELWKRYEGHFSPYLQRRIERYK